jgi:hypothetical protein
MSTLKKIESNYMIIQFSVSYDDHLVLPYKEGIAVLAALENAKIYKKAYDAESTIKDIENNSIKSASIGAQEYGESILRATLLSENNS